MNTKIKLFAATLAISLSLSAAQPFEVNGDEAINQKIVSTNHEDSLGQENLLKANNIEVKSQSNQTTCEIINDYFIAASNRAYEVGGKVRDLFNFFYGAFYRKLTGKSE